MKTIGIIPARSKPDRPIECVSTGLRLTAPKGHDNKALGNALDVAPQRNTSPKGLV